MLEMGFRPLVFLAVAFMSQPCMAARLAQESADYSESLDGIVNAEDQGADDALADFTTTAEDDAEDSLAELTNTDEIPHGYSTRFYDCPYEEIITSREHVTIRQCSELCNDHIQCQGFSHGSHFECYLRPGVCQNSGQVTRNHFTFYAKDIPPFEVVGRWVPMGLITSGGINISSTEGTAQTNTQTTSNSLSTETTTSVSAGFTVYGADVGSSVSASVGAEISTSSAFSRARTHSRTHARSFVVHPGGNYLWQWVFYFHRWGQVQVSTRMERYAQTGGRWEKPACIPGFAHDVYTGYQECFSSKYEIHYDSPI